jgi:PEGA domain-containing protein
MRGLRARRDGAGRARARAIVLTLMVARWQAFLWLLCALLATAPVVAQPAGDAQTPQDPAVAHARERFQEGVKAYEERRYRDAVDLLLEADRSMHSPAFAYNIGLAYEAMEDAASALRWFRSYLREVPATEDRPAVEKRITALEGELQKRGIQQATVLSTPTGATVVIDEKPLGVTPWTGELLPGRHRLEVSLKGRVKFERYIEVLAHRSEDFTAELPPEPPPSAPAPIIAPAPQPEPERRMPKISPWTWGALGGSVLVLGGALAFEVSRASAEDDAREAAQVDYMDKKESAESRQTTARVLAVIGGGLLVGGGVLLAIDLTRTPGPQVGLRCNDNGCLLAGRGVF